MIDITSKLPTSQPYHEIQGIVGDRSRCQGNFDFSGPLDPSGQFLYRLTGVVRDADLFVPGGKDNRTSIAPAFTWLTRRIDLADHFGRVSKSQISRLDVHLSVGGRHHHRIFTGSPSYNSLDQEQGRIGYLFEHALNNAVTVRQKFRYTDLDSVTRYVGILGVDPVTQIASRYKGYVHDQLQSAVVDNQVEAKFLTGPVQHTTLMGLDYTWSSFKDKQGFGFGVSDLNLLAPSYPLEAISDPAIASSTAQQQNQFGAYIQDQAKLDRWILTLSGRNDRVSSRDRI